MQNFDTVAPPQESSNPVFHKVGENLYRHVPSGNYYALLKRGGKQFRRPEWRFDYKKAYGGDCGNRPQKR